MCACLLFLNIPDHWQTGDIFATADYDIIQTCRSLSIPKPRPFPHEVKPRVSLLKAPEKAAISAGNSNHIDPFPIFNPHYHGFWGILLLRLQFKFGSKLALSSWEQLQIIRIWCCKFPPFFRVLSRLHSNLSRLVFFIFNMSYNVITL